MSKKIKRRDFMRTSAVAGLTLATAKSSSTGFPNILVQSGVKPIVVSSANGNRFKNGGDMTAVQKAFLVDPVDVHALTFTVRPGHEHALPLVRPEELNDFGHRHPAASNE